MITAALVLSFILAWAGCWLYLRLAHRWQLYDHPNSRSAHSQPTPRGGGVAIFLGLGAGIALLLASGHHWSTDILLLLGLALVLVAAGIIDDRVSLSVRLRLPLYALVCGVGVWLILPAAPVWLLLLAGFYALWLLNLFNFMDGIDGIAASEAVFALVAAAVLTLWAGGSGSYALLCLLLAAASLGFLCWNWAPARLFMGDAGSVPLGFLLAVLSLLGQVQGTPSLLCWLILLAVFIGDASYTLLWRAWQGETVTEAHSRHLYQRLARHWDSHARVVICMMAYNLLWLLPLAAAAMYRPGYALPALIAAYLPLLPVLLKAGKLP